MDATIAVNVLAIASLGLLLAYVAAQVVNSFWIAGATQRSIEAENRLLSTRIADITSRREFERKRNEFRWDGWRKFEIADKVAEAQGVYSFYLKPHDKKTLPAFLPGQYLTFRLPLPAESKQVVRCYSLSDSPADDYYRITVKRQPPPKDPAKANKDKSSSNWLHDTVEVGDILDAKAPSGHFYLDPAEARPAVLIGGGIGLTPTLSMLNTLVDRNDRREIWYFYGGRNGRDHAFKVHMEAVAREFPNVKYVCCYSDPEPGEEEGGHVRHGRVSVELFKEFLPSNNYDFFFCGPPPMMSSLYEGLVDWGVPDSRIHYEAFGPASVKPQSKQATDEAAAPQATSIKVTFARSAKTVSWNPEAQTLLDLAEENQVTIESGCRAGNCGSCEIAVKQGDVEYLHEPGYEVGAGSCLTCCSVPKTSLVLEA